MELGSSHEPLLLALNGSSERIDQLRGIVVVYEILNKRITRNDISMARTGLHQSRDR